MTKNYVEGLDGGNAEVKLLASFDVAGSGYSLFERRIRHGFLTLSDWALCRNSGTFSGDLNIFDNFEIAKGHYHELCSLMILEMQA